ncbi:hypothetical protein ACOSQ2_029655 [Xanthoceras sorbifolium]
MVADSPSFIFSGASKSPTNVHMVILNSYACHVFSELQIKKKKLLTLSTKSHTHIDMHMGGEAREREREKRELVCNSPYFFVPHYFVYFFPVTRKVHFIFI